MESVWTDVQIIKKTFIRDDGKELVEYVITGRMPGIIFKGWKSSPMEICAVDSMKEAKRIIADMKRDIIEIREEKVDI